VEGNVHPKEVATMRLVDLSQLFDLSLFDLKHFVTKIQWRSDATSVILCGPSPWAGAADSWWTNCGGGPLTQRKVPLKTSSIIHSFYDCVNKRVSLFWKLIRKEKVAKITHTVMCCTCLYCISNLGSQQVCTTSAYVAQSEWTKFNCYILIQRIIET